MSERRKGWVHDVDIFDCKDGRLTYMEEVPAGYSVLPPQLSVLHHVYNRLRELEYKTGVVTCLQFSVHPQGIGMTFKAYSVRMEKEYSIPDVVFLGECEDNNLAISRINVLFDTIHEAMKSIQIINPAKGIHH